MPFALLAALAVSLGVHALALFGTDVDLSTAAEPPPLFVELKLPSGQSVPEPAPALVPSQKSMKKPALSSRRRPLPPSMPHAPEPLAAAQAAPAMLEMPSENSSADSVEDDQAAVSESPPEPPSVAAPQLVPLGMIRYRVERGDQGLIVGEARHRWEIAEGRYRLDAVTETTGLIAFLKPLRIELESRGWITAQGFEPEIFITRRNGRETGEKVTFDRESKQLGIGDLPLRPLVPGTQDLLSFHYQLAFLAEAATPTPLPIASGRKFEYYRFEVLGDEEIETPAGHFQTLHLRVPGNNTTELWLARACGMLPVKIRHVDRRGDSFLQIATEISCRVLDSPNPINE